MKNAAATSAEKPNRTPRERPAKPRRTPRSALKMVFIERAYCPDCDGMKLQTKRSKKESDGSCSRDTKCRVCGLRFLVVVG